MDLRAADAVVAMMPLSPNVLLSNYTTFQLGGPCRFLAQCSTAQELKDTVDYLHQSSIPFILIGGGSNLVVSDEGIDTAVIRYASDSPLIERVNNDLIVTASTELDALALYCVEAGLEGLNFASGIPGTVGGAVVGNAGAWGKQIGDAVKSVTLLDPSGNIKEVDPNYCVFQYRHSRLKETNDIVVSARLKLTEGNIFSLARERADILKKRTEKHPNLNTHPCAGSFFRNICPTSKAEQRQAAGWFLEQAGGKQLSVGGAYIFDKHANIIIKHPHGKAQDVHDLSLAMIKLVKKHFGFELIREVRFVGPFKTEGPCNPQGFW